MEASGVWNKSLNGPGRDKMIHEKKQKDVQPTPHFKIGRGCDIELRTRIGIRHRLH